jgi:hypothetical protein
MEMHVQPTGVLVPARATNSIPTYESLGGKHFWVIQGLWKWNPKTINEQNILDHESMVSLSPPACFHCERVYSSKVASLPCPGESDVF